MFLDSVRSRLDSLERDHLLRNPRVLSTLTGPTAVIEGRTRILLCSNDYLGLAGHPRLREALAAGAWEWGSSASASPQVSGTLEVHRRAEAAVARYLGYPAARLFPTGTAANQGCIAGLVSAGDIVFSDELNHASLIDGCRLSRARVIVYPHADVERLEVLMRRHRHEGDCALVVSDALFSMDGDRAPVEALARLAREWDAGLVLDEAHALGVIGAGGRGLAATEGIRPDVLIGTFGKSFGLAGAFVAAQPEIIELISNRARTYVFSTAMLPSLASAIPTAIDLVRDAETERARLHRGSCRMREALRALGYQVPEGDSAIIPVLLGAAERATELSNQLFDRDLFVHAIRPPTVARGTSRLRVVPTAAHQSEHLDRSIEAFRHVRPANSTHSPSPAAECLSTTQRAAKPE